jgi:hypothetical protein
VDPRFRLLVTNAFALLALVVVACDDASDLDGGAASTSEQERVAPVDRRAVGELSQAAINSGFDKLRLTSCPGRLTVGGFDGWVAGLSCDEVGDLFLALGDPIGRYNESKEVVYRPRAAEVAEWTCWARFDVRDAEVRHVCWTDTAIVLFKFA